MIALLARTAFSTILGLWMAEAFRSKETGSSNERTSNVRQSEEQVETGKDVSVGSLENSLRLAHVRRLVGAADGNPEFTGHYEPFDVQFMRETLQKNFPGARIAGALRKEDTMDFGSIGADVLFGAGDSDVLEALAVSGGGYDIVGGDGSSEIIGAELIGAAAAGNKAALRQIAMRKAGAVVQNQLKNRRRYPLGFVPTEVDSGDAATIPAAPQNLFRPERLVIPSDICFDFGVQDIKVGNQSQFAQSVEVPAAVFSEVSIDTNVTFDTAEVGNQISILVRNKGTTDDLEFTAAAIGTIAKS